MVVALQGMSYANRRLQSQIVPVDPAVPGINMPGDYWDHYARDPLHWVKTELEVCRNYHPMFMKMVGADGKYCHGEGARFWSGGCCGVDHAPLPSNCCGDHCT